ncbi:spore coat associated protein CotJA [Halobacillus sp. ACCC02827]|uniref:spore coat associated protein CotJA n=1 Tax=Bacillaceae TaxID=186817 RepID=UPI0002A4E7CA|nr:MULTISPECIES: spore coat associated protein CotJA [Bacillaceae]ELK45367.1 cotJA protein [Halobacillus sp. BAB-2008]QHT48676.1 spore coat associated protein CotJA [Bacillus sp. SB49]WJE17681.1 spore coat associated protein CotJA [Halobacillus sp. ACCC02827]
MYTPIKCYQPYHSPNDPCPPRGYACYQTPPNLYLGFQPPNLPQFSLQEALYKGTLWPVLFDPYPTPLPQGGKQ